MPSKVSRCIVVTRSHSGEDSCALLPNMQAISDAASVSVQHDDNDSNKFKNYTLREY
jgi:hypothetical protein